MEEYIRDYTMAAAILGLFSFVWFGWAQERPRKSWRVCLGIGSTLGIIVSAAGIYLSITHWNGASILHEQSNFTYYIIFVAIEFTVAAVISAVLLIKKHSDYVAPWIAFVVGVHFFPLSFVFDDFLHRSGRYLTRSGKFPHKIYFLSYTTHKEVGYEKKLQY